MNHFDLSLIGLTRVSISEGLTLRLDGESTDTRYRQGEVVNLPSTAAELLIRAGKAARA